MASQSPFPSEGQSTVGEHSASEAHSTLEVGIPYAENQSHPLPEFHPEAPQYQEAAPTTLASKYTEPAVPDDKEHAPNADGGGDGRICGLRKKFFFILLAMAALMTIGLAVGLGVGLTMRSDGDLANDGNSSDGNSNDGPSNPLRSSSKISAASFTDEYSNTNTIVVYQREDRSIYMSTFNTSKNEWKVSPVVNGSDGVSLDTVREDTALAVNVYVHNSEKRHVRIFWQQTNNALQYLYRRTIRTDEESGPDDWQSGFDEDHPRSAVNGSTIAVHGRPCSECKRNVFLFFQDANSEIISGRLTGEDETAWIWNNTEAPKTDRGLFMATASVPNADAYRVFYRRSDGRLVAMGNDEEVKEEYHITTIDRQLGTDDALAAFATETERTGFQVLSKGTGADDHVLLTYLYKGDWKLSGRVQALDDCSPKGAMAATYDRRVYCVVDTEDGVGIKGWEWKGDGEEPTSFAAYDEIGVVDTTGSTK